MKVLVVSGDLGNGGGLAQVINAQSKACFERDASLSFDFASSTRLTDSQVLDFESMNGRVHYYRRFSESPLAFYRDINEIIGCDQYDAIHIHMGHLNWLVGYIAKRQRVGAIILHAHSSRARSQSVLFRLAMELNAFLSGKVATKMFAVSEEAGLTYFGNGFEVLPNFIKGVDRKLITEAESKAYDNEFGIADRDSRLKLGFFGHLDINKHPEFAIAITEFLQDNGFEPILLLAGKGGREDELKELVFNRNLESWVKMIGYRNDGRTFLQYIDVLLCPSEVEGMSISLLEAQRLGTPCVVSPTIPKSNDLRIGLYYQARKQDYDSWQESILCAYRNGKKHLSDYDFSIAMKRIGYDEESIVNRILYSYYNTSKSMAER